MTNLKQTDETHKELFQLPVDLYMKSEVLKSIIHLPEVPYSLPLCGPLRQFSRPAQPAQSVFNSCGSWI